MRQNVTQSATVAVLAAVVGTLSFCTSGHSDKPAPGGGGGGPVTEVDPVQRGGYIVATSGCHDCHSPKVMTPKGPVPDTSRLLSGHPAGSTLPPMDPKATRPGNWVLMAPDITAFVGPWGGSFAANLTSDSATGIGAWTLENFVNAMKTGKHMGHPGGRDILPPMPWPQLARMTDEDLRAVFAYLKSLPPVHNRVPQPVAPGDVGKK
ncbi:c-type cytochrome [Paraflavisolibacter sp. H34]|uniref:c-type cytochrome n=1 Tax=Huijunlia imazamoxiresistens TaxID=3127457 RepID=UPI00301B11B0